MTVANSLNIPSVLGTVVVGTGTGFDVRNYSAIATADYIAQYDGNANFVANAFIPAYATTATASATTTLTALDPQQQYFTGSLNQTVVLPITASMVDGQSFLIVNRSSGVVSVESSGANLIQAMAANTALEVTVINATVTTAAGWNALYSGAGAPGAIALTGDSGTITGSALTLFANNTGNHCGSSVKFSNSSTTSTLSLSDSNNNTMLGEGAGNLSMTGHQNDALGAGALASLTSGGNNFAGGYQALNLLQDGTNCVAIGLSSMAAAISASNCIAIGQLSLSLSQNDTGNISIGYSSLSSLNGGLNNCSLGHGSGLLLSSGSYNLYAGFGAGSVNNAAESSNLYLNHPGVAAESNVLRIGNGTGAGNQQLASAFLSGVNGVTLGGTPKMMVIDSSTDQMGVMDIPASTFNWIDVTSSTQLIAANSGYVTDNATQVTYTLPATPLLGDIFKITGGASGSAIAPWLLEQNALQQINFGYLSTTIGTGGALTSTLQYDSIECVCVVAGASAVWVVLSSQGNIDVS